MRQIPFSVSSNFADSRFVYDTNPLAIYIEHLSIYTVFSSFYLSYKTDILLAGAFGFFS